MKNEKFYEIVKPYINNSLVAKMDSFSHHTSVITCFDHSVLVAFLCYKLAPKFKCNLHSSVKTGLLHDLYLSYRENSNTGKVSMWKHLRLHPHIAAENASCFNLSQSEQNIIKKHMWPINIKLMPKTREEILINVADKISTIIEITGLYWVLKSVKGLRVLKPVNA